MSQSDFESPLMPRELADAPDIENVPVSDWMNTLSQTVMEMHYELRQIGAHLGVPSEDASPATPDPSLIVCHIDESAGMDPAVEGNGTTYSTKDDHTADQCEFEPCADCGCCAHGKQHVLGCSTEYAPVGFACPNDDCGCTGQGKAGPRMVPADQPEVRATGGIVDPSTQMVARPEGTECLIPLGPRGRAASESPLMPIELADASDIENVPAASSMHTLMGAFVDLHQEIREMRAEVGNALHAARPATPSEPATPAVGVGSSAPVPGAQIGAGEVGLGERIRAVLARTGVPSEVALREFADRADALEHDLDAAVQRHLASAEAHGATIKASQGLQRTIDRLNDENTRQSETIGRVRDQFVRMTKSSDEKTQRHGTALLHILDGDS